MADENKFLAIYNPYPPMPRLDPKGVDDEDTRKLVEWLACFLGNENVMSLYYKPRSPGIVIVEVNYEFTDWQSILGGHIWSKVFKEKVPFNEPDKTPESASKEDREGKGGKGGKEGKEGKKIKGVKDIKGDKEDKGAKEDKEDKEEDGPQSKVYYSTFSLEQQVRNNGWKLIPIKDKWLYEWNPANNKVVNCPYPKVVWCDVPPVEVGAIQLCRNIPKSNFPGLDDAHKTYQASKTEVAHPGIPGTEEWAKKKAAPKPAAPKNPLLAGSSYASKFKPESHPSPVVQSKGTAVSTSKWSVPLYSSVTETAMRAVAAPEPAKNRTATSTSGRSTASVSIRSDSISQKSSDLVLDDSNQNLGGWNATEPSWGVTAPVTKTLDSTDTNIKKKAKTKENKAQVPAASWEDDEESGSPGDVIRPSQFQWADDHDDERVPPTSTLSDSHSETEIGAKGALSANAVSAQRDEPSPGDQVEGAGGWDEEPTEQPDSEWKCKEHGHNCNPGICKEAKKHAKEVQQKERAAKAQQFRDEDGNRIWRQPKGRKQSNPQSGRGRGQGKVTRGGK